MTNQRGWPYADMGNPQGQNNQMNGEIPYQGQRLAQNMVGKPPSPFNMGASETLFRPSNESNIKFKTVLENRAKDSESHNVTVTTLINQILLGPQLSGKFTSILGKVTWGIGGVITFAEFDWHNGNQFSVNATFLEVSATINTIDTATPSQVTVGAMYTEGTRPARAQLTRTFPKTIIQPDASLVVPVPPFAHALYIFDGNVNFYSPGSVEIRYAGGPVVGATYATGDDVQFVADGSDFLDPIFNEDGARFPEQTRFIQIINNSLENIEPVVTFTLNL